MESPFNCKLLVLNYHSIEEQESANGIYNTTVFKFKEHLDLIVKTGIPVIDIGKLQEPLKYPLNIAITFDDGYSNHLTNVLPELTQRNLPACFFPVINQIGKLGYLRKDDIREIVQAGYSVGSHGMSHTRVGKLSPADLQNEITMSKIILEQDYGVSVNCFAPPYGLFTKATVAYMQRAGYTYLLSTSLYVNTFPPENAVIYRWNIRNDTTAQQIEYILRYYSKLPIGITFPALTKRLAKRFWAYF
ncbi:MAG: polysaccharide deacetylase family protein [Sediminibacterium sp.]|nr:polysaccharide deacetylase family protein [Sediminibacterium sp.]